MTRWLVMACVLGLAGSVTADRGAGLSRDVVVAELLDEIEAKSAKQQRVESELQTARAAHGAAGQQLRERTRALYRLTRAGRAPVTGGFEAVRRHVARVARLKRLVKADLRELATLAGTLQALKTRTQDLQSQVAQARDRLASVQEGAGFAAPQAGGPMAVLAGQQPSGYSPPAAAPSTFYGIRFSDQREDHSFASLRGSLASPIDGEVRVVSARREESDGPGLEFQAPAGTAVRAVAGGRVAFSDTYGSYGRLVILDHGDSYYTVYGGLGTVEVRVGDDLSRRARLGSIGSHSQPSALFFEVRRGTRTLEPRGWIGL